MNDVSHTKSATVTELDENLAIKELANTLEMEDAAGAVLFFSAKYSRVKLETAIAQYFDYPIFGCTTAGEIGPEYVDGISAVSFSSSVFKLHPVLFDLSGSENSLDCSVLTKIENQNSIFTEGTIGKSSVGFVLIDGLSMKEEGIIENLHNSMPNLPIFGGSAGDGMNFNNTFTFIDGEFHKQSALFIFIETSLDFEIFKLQHFEPSEIELIVTDADTSSRIVYEFDGEPAAQCFAESIGKKVDDLAPDLFAVNPLMLEICGDWYARDIQSANDDGSLQFSCAIDVGLPLTVGRGTGIIDNLRNNVDTLLGKFSSIERTVGCDCLMRRLEIFKNNKQEKISHILQEINFTGFSTYGEQLNSLHINQTLTGVVFGTKNKS